MANNAIDLKDVLERVQDDWELLFELLDIFEQDFKAKRPQFDELLKQKNCEKIRDLAHSLKGAAGNISAKALFQSFYQLEKLAEGRDLSRSGEILKNVDLQFRDLQASAVELKKNPHKS